MNIREFKILPAEEKAKFELDRIGCDGQKMIAQKGHTIGTFHAICPVCESCHDCDDGE